MTPHFPTFVINLDGSDDRLASATTQLQTASMPFTRVSAFDGRKLDVHTDPSYDGAWARGYLGRDLNGGEIGCYNSHLACARAFLDTGADIGVVLEDDMKLMDPTGENLRCAVNWLANTNTPWDLVNIGPNRLKIQTPITTIQDASTTFDIVKAHYFPMTTTGLIWSRKGAQTFVQNHNKIALPVDDYFRYALTRTGRGLSVWPPLIQTIGADSDINQAGSERKSGTHRTFSYGWKKQKRLNTDKAIALWHKLKHSVRG